MLALHPEICSHFFYLGGCMKMYFGLMNLGIDAEYHKSYEIIELDYLRPKTTEGTK